MVLSISNRRFYSVSAVLLALVTLAAIAPDSAHAAAAGGGLPWEAPLTTITRSLQGPVAYAISLLGIVSCGGMLIWGGEINEFMRRGIMLVLVISLVVLASSVLSSLFTTTGAVL
jgi:type IV secretory pathway VirB2 component (pilin)